MAEPSSKAEGGDSAAPGNGQSAESGVEAGGGGSVLGAVASAVMMAFLAVIAIVSTLWNAITEDGTLAAAGRQGLDEIGAALKPFPDSIQTQESGTVWNPTQGEIAAARKGNHQPRGIGYSSFYSSYSHTSGPRESWPSEIAKDQRPVDPGEDHRYDADQDDGHSM